MKGTLEWMIFWLFVTLAVTIVIIVWQGPAVLGTADQAIKLGAKYKAMQVAGAINAIQGAPDGASYKAELPKGGPNCIEFTSNSVKVNIADKSEVYLIEPEFGSAGLAVENEIDCSAHKNIVITKSQGTIRISSE